MKVPKKLIMRTAQRLQYLSIGKIMVELQEVKSLYHKKNNTKINLSWFYLLSFLEKRLSIYNSKSL